MEKINICDSCDKIDSDGCDWNPYYGCSELRRRRRREEEIEGKNNEI